MTDVERLEFPGRPGRTLVGDLHRPERPLGLVVIAHGLHGSRSSSKHVAVAEACVSRGLAALRFDFAGRGESEGSDDDVTLSGEREDLMAAVTHGRRRTGELPVSLVGSSLGGTVAILVASAGGVSRLVTIAAPIALPEGVRGLPSRLTRDAAGIDLVAAGRRIDVPWRVVHAADDDVVPVDHAEAWVAVSGTAELIRHPAGGHRFEEPSHRAWLVERVVEFLDRKS